MDTPNLRIMVISLALSLVALGAGSLKAQDKVVIGGSGSLIDEMEDVAKVYKAKHPGDSIQVLQESMSSTGGIEGVKMGRLTIGLVTRELRGAEKEKLVYRVVGRTPAGVAVNKAITVNDLSESQICDILSGKIKTWKEVGGGDVKITVLNRDKDDSNIETIRSKMPCFKETRITSDAIVLIRGSEVLDALDKRVGTIGIVNIGSSLFERQNAKPLAIAGVPPSPEAVQTGKYKYYNERGVVTLGNPQGAAKRFLDFVGSPEGQKILARRGVISTGK
jgi:phosphate transport system substrate-binding protein